MKLSVVIPAYNVEKYIKKTIESLIVQAEKDFEIIIIDDGSTDNTLKAVNEIIKEKDLSNCVIIKKINGGVSSARNVGISKAIGKYILFLDGDDYVSKDLVGNIYKNMDKDIDNKEIDIICWGCNIVSEQGDSIKNYFDVFKLKYKSMNGIEALSNMISYKNMWIYTGSAVYRKEFLEEYNIEFTEGCANGEDQEFTIKALARASEVIFIDKSLSYYVLRKTSISNSYNIKRFDFIAAMERTYKYMDSLEKSGLKLIKEKIKNQHIVDNYIYNFDCCLEHECFDNLYNDIEVAYPSLNKKVISSMKSYSGNNIKIIFKVKIFLISRLMYIWVFSLKNKIKKIRKR